MKWQPKLKGQLGDFTTATSILTGPPTSCFGCVIRGPKPPLTQATSSAILCYGQGNHNLDTAEISDEAAEPPVKVKSVAGVILGEFFDALAKEEGFAEIAPRLRKVVLEEGIFAEPSIRTALFPDVS